MGSATATAGPVRIARIITRLNIGGPAIQAIELSARLESAGYHTLLIHGRLGPDEGDMRYLLPRDPAFEIAHVPALRRALNPVADVAATARVFRLLRQFKPTIVHSHMSKAGTIGRAAGLLYNATAGAGRRARLVHTYHGQVFDGHFSSLSSRGFVAVERVLGRRTDALIAISAAVQRDLVERHRIAPPERFHIVPLGFDLSRLAAIAPGNRAAARVALGIDPCAHVVSFVGRLTAIKQPHLLVEAAALVAARDQAAHCLVAGGGELEREVRAGIMRTGLAARIHLLGWQHDVSTVYAASDLAVLTSRNEGTPVALIEAMAAGVPGVAFAVGGVPDVIRDAAIGVLVPEGDVDALAGAICELLSDEPRRRAMGAAARASVLGRFNIDRLVADVTALYGRLL